MSKSKHSSPEKWHVALLDDKGQAIMDHNEYSQSLEQSLLDFSARHHKTLGDGKAHHLVAYENGKKVQIYKIAISKNKAKANPNNGKLTWTHIQEYELGTKESLDQIAFDIVMHKPKRAHESPANHHLSASKATLSRGSHHSKSKSPGSHHSKSKSTGSHHSKSKSPGGLKTRSEAAGMELRDEHGKFTKSGTKSGKSPASHHSHHGGTLKSRNSPGPAHHKSPARVAAAQNRPRENGKFAKAEP
jgi:hypothetical protein